MDKYIIKELINFINKINDFNEYSFIVTSERRPTFESIKYLISKNKKVINIEIITYIDSVHVDLQYKQEDGMTSGIKLTRLTNKEVSSLLSALKECEYRKENVLNWYTILNNF